MISRRMCMGLITQGRGRFWGLIIGGWRRVLKIQWRLFWSGNLDNKYSWTLILLKPCLRRWLHIYVFL